jgi:pyruvate/oxaloacetate carboxyltransferase
MAKALEGTARDPQLNMEKLMEVTDYFREFARNIWRMDAER